MRRTEVPAAVWPSVRHDVPLRAVVVGAGQRGYAVYGRWALEHADDIRIVAVVDPHEGRRARFGEAHAIPAGQRFADVPAFIAAALPVEAAIVASPDRAHAAHAIALLGAGLEVLLEKPLATSTEELARLVHAARAAPGRLSVAHVLRYTPFFQAVNDIVLSGRLGEVISVVHTETLAWWHMAHSYVRGNWARAESSSPAILAKCCHDLDILMWNSTAEVARVASFGSMRHFRPESAPAQATARCTDGCPVIDCRFDARRIYLAVDAEPWLLEAVADDLASGSVEDALRSGPYGRCVYHAGSDVVDHQVVAMERDDGSTATLVFSGHGKAGARTMVYDGTRASLRGSFGTRASLEIHDHGGTVEVVEIEGHGGAHGGGDDGIMRAFVTEAARGRGLTTDVESAVESHLLAFAAEESRSTGRIVDMADFRVRALGTAHPHDS